MPLGKELDVLGQYMTPREVAETLQRVSGQKVQAADISNEMFHTPEFRQKIGDELWLK
jgi:hypothetical protein